MAKGGQLLKLKSVLKKWNSFSSKYSSRSSSINSVSSADDDYSSSPNNAVSSRDLQAVYVGKSRRRYLVGPDVVDHPLFKELADRSSSSDDDTINVACEVVMFEHLLWMLENADPQPESMDDLVEFYAC